MIQLIVYTGLYWAVSVMERLLVVNSATACAPPSHWISTLPGPRSWGETARPGTDCWCFKFMATMSFLLPENTHSLAGDHCPIVVCHRSGRAHPPAGAHRSSLWPTLRLGRGGGRSRWRMMGRRTATGGETMTDMTLLWIMQHGISICGWKVDIYTAPCLNIG